MIFFSNNLKESFDRAKVWVKELQRQGSPNIIIALVGNKVDLADKRQVETLVSFVHCQVHILFGFQFSNL